MKKQKRKEVNDKAYTQFGKEGWCLKENVACFGDCTECTLRRFPELVDQVDLEWKYAQLFK